MNLDQALDRIKELELELDKTSRELFLEKLKNVQPYKDFPTIPAPPSPWNPQAEKQHCGKCGIELNTVMGYCCPHSNCPCGLGPIQCTTIGTSNSV